MADFGSPVAQNVDVNPQRQIGTLSALMGLRQQQLGIQQQQQQLGLGAQRLQVGQSEAQLAQQQMKERLAVQQMMQSGVDDQGNSIRDANGAPSSAKMLPALGRIAPLTGQDLAQKVIKTETDKVGLQAASTTLDATQRQMLMAPVQAAALGGAKSADIVAGIDNLVQQHPEMGNAAQYLKGLLTHLDNIPPQGRMQAVQSIAAHMQVGQPVQTQPGQAAIDIGGAVKTGTTGPPVTGGGFTPATTTGKTLAPQLVTTPAGPIVEVGGGGGGGATKGPPGAQPPPPGPIPAALNLTRAQVEAQLGAAGGITSRVQQAQTAANNTIQAQDALSRVKAVLEGPNAPATGTAFLQRRDIQNLFASAGIDTQGTTDMNTLVKNLARYEAARATAAGLGNTDAARDLSHNGQPNVAIDNRALLGIVNQSLATEKAIAAYANKQSQTTDPKQLQQNENTFRNIPNLIEGYQYGMTRSPAEANKFLGEHRLTPQQMAVTRRLIKGFEKP